LQTGTIDTGIIDETMANTARELPLIAIAAGGPAGIGPQISLNAALDRRRRKRCRPLVVGDPAVVAQHAQDAGLVARLRVVNAPGFS
jgi:4-hydroxy-L-threonine phosphate dehydrogenase PdxA